MFFASVAAASVSATEFERRTAITVRGSTSRELLRGMVLRTSVWLSQERAPRAPATSRMDQRRCAWRIMGWIAFGRGEEGALRSLPGDKPGRKWEGEPSRG